MRMMNMRGVGELGGINTREAREASRTVMGIGAGAAV